AKHGNETVKVLRKFLNDRRPPERVVLVTDERRRPPLGDKGEELKRQLEQLGHHRFLHLELPFTQYLDLDALQAVVGLAPSVDLAWPGDLELTLLNGRQPVTEEDGITSPHRKQRSLAQPLLREVLAPPEGPTPRPGARPDAMARR